MRAMIAIDITKFLKSFPHVRGPAIFLNALISASLDRDVHFAFNPHFVGSQLYFQVVSAKEFPPFWAQQMTASSRCPPQRNVTRKILRFIRDIALEFYPELANRFPILQRGRGLSQSHYPLAPVVHHSHFKQMLSFYPSDSLWGLPMAETKKTLFLYDLTFFEILRMISSPVNCSSSPFIVQHIIDVNRAIAEAHSIMVPTHYLAEQLPRHFPMARNRPVDVVPLASTLVYSRPGQGNGIIRFKPLRKSGKEKSVLVVCGFDGFKNDNKGMGAILDIICLHKKLFDGSKPIHFKLVTPKLPDLIQRIEELNIADTVTVVSGLSMSDLIEEYQKAKFLWVHSIDEGFCLPVLEASMLDLPVFISDIPSLREIWADTVDYINVFNRYEAVNTLHAYYIEERKALKGANSLRAQGLTIEKTVEGIWAALEKVR